MFKDYNDTIKYRIGIVEYPRLYQANVAKHFRGGGGSFPLNQLILIQHFVSHSLDSDS